jgi:hypothetical protein
MGIWHVKAKNGRQLLRDVHSTSGRSTNLVVDFLESEVDIFLSCSMAEVNDLAKTRVEKEFRTLEIATRGRGGRK